MAALSSLLRRFVTGPRRFLLLGVLVFLVLSGIYWLLPISGQVTIIPGDAPTAAGLWPRIRLDPPLAKPGDSVSLTVEDTTAWNGVTLLVAHSTIPLLRSDSRGNPSWQWRFTLPAQPGAEAVFYHDCATGCIESARFRLGPAVQSPPSPPLLPTKLGVVFADPQRDWHGRAGWDVELGYSQRETDSDFGIDALAENVLANSARGVRVLVRLDYDQGQALPPPNDDAALARYLAYCARIARDARLQTVYGYIIGSTFNRISANSLAAGQPLTPELYARLFNGYGLAATRTDNVAQTIHGVNPTARVLVGPVTPWVSDQTGSLLNTPDAPWLDYMNTLVARLDAAAGAKGVSAMPDGFALQASGRPEASATPAQEPAQSIRDPRWGTAQMGFQVYTDWLAIINRYATTSGSPVFITAANTYAADTQIEPAQNYPSGWLATALATINREPQIQALCWYVDLPYDKWSSFSLRLQVNHMQSAANEFDQLLRQ